MAETNEPVTSDPAPAIAAPAAPASVPVAVAPSHVVPVHTTSRAAAASGPTGHPPHHRGGLHGVVKFIAWVFSGFGLLSALRKGGAGFNDQEIIVYSAHRAFFLWPLVFIGFIGAFIVHHWPSAGGALGWIYVFVLTYTLVSLLFDISTWKFLLWAGIIAFIYVLCRLAEEKWKIVIIQHVFKDLVDLHPQLDHGFAVMMSWLLLIPWIGALFSTFTNGRKRFTPNEISEWHLGDGTEMTDRTGMKFRTTYRDVFESLLGFGAGDLLGIDGTGVTRKRWENILFLYFVWDRMDAILHQRASIVDNTARDPVEVEEVRPSNRPAGQ